MWLRLRRSPEIDNRLFSNSIPGPIALSAPLECGAVFNHCPRLLGKDDAAILVFFYRKDQALPVPNDGSMELIPVSPGGHRCFAVGTVALYSVPGQTGTTESSRLHSQIRIAMLDVQDDIARPLGQASFIALFPCSREIRVQWRADSGSDQKQRRD